MPASATSVDEILTNATAPWPAFAGRQGEAFAALDDAIRARGQPGLWTGLPRLELGIVESIRDEPPQGWSGGDPDWRAVVSVVEDAVGLKDQVGAYYAGVDTFLERTQVEQMAALDRAAQWVDLSTQVEVPFDFLGLFTSILNLVTGVAGAAGVPGTGAVSGLGGIVSWIVRSSQGTDGPDPWEASFKDTVYRVKEEVQQRYGKMTDAVAGTRDTLLSDYGKLRQMGVFLSDPSTTWPDTVGDLFSPPVQNGAELSMWQILLPARWPVVDVHSPLYVPPSQAPQTVERIGRCSPQWYVARIGAPMHTEGGPRTPLTMKVLAESAYGEQLRPDAAQRLFGVLGADRDQLFARRAPWDGLQEVQGFTEAFPPMHSMC